MNIRKREWAYDEIFISRSRRASIAFLTDSDVNIYLRQIQGFSFFSQSLSKLFAASCCHPLNGTAWFHLSALEPVISGKIMELHHSKHHQAYVNGYNAAYKQFKEVQRQDQLHASPTFAVAKMP